MDTRTNVFRRLIFLFFFFFIARAHSSPRSINIVVHKTHAPLFRLRQRRPTDCEIGGPSKSILLQTAVLHHSPVAKPRAFRKRRNLCARRGAKRCGRRPVLTPRNRSAEVHSPRRRRALHTNGRWASRPDLKLSRDAARTAGVAAGIPPSPVLSQSPSSRERATRREVAYPASLPWHSARRPVCDRLPKEDARSQTRNQTPNTYINVAFVRALGYYTGQLTPAR